MLHLPFLERTQPELQAASRHTAEKLEVFSHLTALERLAFDAVAFCTPPAVIDDIRSRFLEMDADGSGTLSRSELGAALLEHMGETQCDTLFAAMDIDGTGEVDYTEFVGAMVSGADVLKDPAVVKSAFEALDTDNSGKVSKGEVAQILRGSLNEAASHKFDELAGSDGEVDLDEFRLLLEELASLRTAVPTSGS